LFYKAVPEVPNALMRSREKGIKDR